MCRAMREIKRSAANKGATIVDPHHDFGAGFHVRHGDARAKRQAAVRGCQATPVEALATRCVRAEPLAAAIPASADDWPAADEGARDARRPDAICGCSGPPKTDAWLLAAAAEWRSPR